MSEIWKDVVGYEGLYQVSNLGRVKSLKYNHSNQSKLLRIAIHHSGYRKVSLSKDSKAINKTVHKLVADAFLSNPNNKPCVNHIDGDKGNNAVSNLEWVTYSENTRHAIRTGLRADSNMRGRLGILNPSSKRVHQFTKDGELVKTWDCISDAARFLNCNPCMITNCCAGRIKSAKGYVWKHVEA